MIASDSVMIYVPFNRSTHGPAAYTLKNEEPKTLDYQNPSKLDERRPDFGIVSLVFAALAVFPTYIAGKAVHDSRLNPGFYGPFLFFGYAFWLVVLAAGIGAVFAVVGLLQTHRAHRWAKVALPLNIAFLVAMLVMAVLINR